MAAKLAVLSFICATFLAVFISVERIHMSVPRLAIILWLFGYNFVHGINALVWSGNVDIHVPVWCDIVTNFMLGANLALPAALLCISRQLELLSSTRTVSSHPTVVRNRFTFDIFMCYILPILYMLLHLIVQDNRFDLVENIGCSASVDPSGVGFSIMWIPPLLICIISLVFSALSIRNSFRHARFATHLESRLAMTYSSFFRCLSISMTTTAAAGLVYISCFCSGPAFHPWSWSAVHATMSEINIVSSQDEVKSIELSWWGGFIVSVLYLLLSFFLGEETRDIFQWIKKQATRERHFVLPIHLSGNAPSLHAPWSEIPGRPSTIEYKSGWDDMLHVKAPKAGKALSLMIPTRSSTTRANSTIVTEDETFTASTLSYLGSPTEKNFGLRGSPAPLNNFEIPPKPRIPPPPSPTVTEDIVLFSPTSPLPSLPASCYLPNSGIRPPAASLEETPSNPRCPTLTLTPPPPDLSSHPLEGSSTASNEYDDQFAGNPTVSSHKPVTMLPDTELTKGSESNWT